ncbi:MULTISPECIES: YqeB family protein [unclassified Kribbella]|uniref:YqeB family protein n=1 Tax=unclassified Kribbella TaxID=2644121 RepID=UPI00301676DD
MTTQTPARTVIGHSTTDKVVLFGGFPLVGLVLGFFLPRIADWATTLGWVPFQGPLELIAGWDEWWVSVICIVIGLLAGVLLAAIALEDTLKVTVTGQSVEFLKNQKTVTVPREKVAVAFLDGKEIVLQDSTSRELAREKHDQLKSEAKQIPAAFRAHGYPWSDGGDPHAARFRRWVEDEPDLPPTVNAVLKVRSKAFDQGDKGKADLRELRDEVTKLGYTVKDKEKRQYWRATTLG